MAQHEEQTTAAACEQPLLCANNCGFFGSKATLDLCSRCYREVLKAQEAFESAAKPANPTLPSSSSSGEKQAVKFEEQGLQEQTHEVAKPEQPKQQPDRCLSCNKRVGLTGFKCKCEGVFCSLHRYSDKHDCDFDYKARQRELVAKANPVIKADKINKI